MFGIFHISSPCMSTLQIAHTHALYVQSRKSFENCSYYQLVEKAPFSNKSSHCNFLFYRFSPEKKRRSCLLVNQRSMLFGSLIFQRLSCSTQLHYKLEILANIFLSCFSNNWYLTGFFKMSLCHRITCDETRHAGCVRTNLSEFLHFLRLRVQASHVLEPVGNLPRQLTSEVHQQPNCCDLKLFLRHSAPVHEPCFPM